MAQPTLLTYGVGAVDEILTAAMPHMIPGIKDNVFNENTALGWFNKAGKKSIKGGTSISHGLRYGGTSTSQAYSRYETLGTTPIDGLTRDQWNWKQYSSYVAVDGFQTRTAPGGDNELADILEEKKSFAQDDLRNKLEGDLFKASPTTNELRSLPLVVLDSGTEGQVNGTTNTWWRAVVNTGGSFAAGTGRSQLVNTINTLSKRKPVGMPELLLSDQTSYEAYEGILVNQYRFEGSSADVGLKTLTFKGIPWMWSVQATSGVIYILHSDAIKLYTDSATDFLWTGFKVPTNQDAKVGHILLTVALATCARRKLGKTTSNAA